MQRLLLSRLLIVSLSFFLLNTTLFAQSGGFTLDQCIFIAWKNNLRLQQQRLGVDIARQNLSQSRANMLPSINANASHMYNIGRTIDPFTNEFATETVQSNNFSITTGMNLFSGFQVQNAIRQNRLELQAGELDLEKSYNDLALLVASAYLQILFSVELVNTVTGQIEVTQQQVERTQRLVSAGTLARGALLTIQAQLATEEMQLVNAQNQLDLAMLNLKQIMFMTLEDDFAIAVPEIDIDMVGEQEYSPLQIYQVALRQQPGIKSSELRILSAERGLAMARGALSPMLSIRGSYGTGYSGARYEITETRFGEPRIIGMTESMEPVYAPTFEYDRRVTPFSTQLDENVNKSIGLFLTIPIFNNLQVQSNMGRSRINLENAKLQHQIAREDLFQVIQQSNADATAALKRYTATQKNVAALQESFRYMEQRFTVGMVNTIEYNDAKNRLSAAESELLQSKYEYIFRMKILDFYLGLPLSL
jgi:outer membrane protein